ncbi:putative membrane protein [Rhodoligotrophos appendicifer]|uniref:YcjF family protein n=1 Tax=Rhodoligotrophos appendicifer TaxID=987056 RepID=UPI00147899D0|nr:TIGR01620 family protein [Rhodoligotrophos appendicifer]
MFEAPPPPPPSPPGTEEEQPALRHLAGRRRGWRWGAIFWSALSGLLLMAFSYWAYSFVETLFAREDWLGWTALGLAFLAGIAAVAIVIREIWGLSRLEQIGTVRALAERTLRSDKQEDATETLRGLKALYGHRVDMARAIENLSYSQSEIIDPADRVRLAERALMTELDRDAAGLIARSSRRVSILTALTPAAALDVVFVAAQNLVMLRGLATLYGSRPHLLGTIRLAKMVLTHLAVTGSIAFSDTLLQHVIGRGLAGRLSARVGEGAVNGIMTARIGLTAIDVVRPLPFETLKRPRLSAIAGRIGDTVKDEED